MEKLGFKIAGAIFSMLLMNVSLAADPVMENATAPSKDHILTPGAKVIAGLPGKNDFYILGRNEKMPTELTEQAKVDMAAKKPQVAQTKAKTSPTDTVPTVVNATTDALNSPVANPTLDVKPVSEINPTRSTQNDKAVTSMKKVGHRTIAANKKPAYLKKVAQKNKSSKSLQKEAKNNSSHTVKHNLASAKAASHVAKHNLASAKKASHVAKHNLASSKKAAHVAKHNLASAKTISHATKHTLAAAKNAAHTKYKFASKAHSKSLQHALIATA